MNRRELLTAATASVALAAWGSMPGMKGMDPMLGALSSQLGVSDTQAGGGLGSILSLAKSKLSTQDFSQVSKAIPGAESYIKAAQQALGSNGSITDKAGLKSAFAKLGITPDMIDKFKPVLLETAGKSVALRSAYSPRRRWPTCSAGRPSRRS